LDHSISFLGQRHLDAHWRSGSQHQPPSPKHHDATPLVSPATLNPSPMYRSRDRSSKVAQKAGQENVLFDCIYSVEDLIAKKLPSIIVVMIHEIRFPFLSRYRRARELTMQIQSLPSLRADANHTASFSSVQLGNPCCRSWFLVSLRPVRG